MEFSFLQVSITIMALAAIAQTSLAYFPETALPPPQHSDSVSVFLAAHNAARATVGVPPVTWNASVASYAEAYAATRSADCALQHSRGPYGENIAEGYPDLSAADSVKMWVGEKANYDYSSNSCVGGECLHYTQVVWRDSVSIGCARVTCKNNGWMFVTCNYYPPGNYIGERPY